MPFFLALASSGLLYAATPGLWQADVLAWIALVPLLAAIADRTPRQAFGLGFLCGIAYFTSILPWILIVLGRYGGLPLIVSVPALLLLAGYMALSPAAWAWIARRIPAPLPRVVVLPAAWVALDFFRAWFCTGFPWQDLGYTQYGRTHLIQGASLLGHHGLTFLIVTTNVALFDLGARLAGRTRSGSSWRRLFLSALMPPVMAGLFLVPDFLQENKNTGGSAARLAVGVIQGNIDQSEKWLPEIQKRTVDTYLGLSAQAVADGGRLLVWPETALPFFPDDHPLFTTVSNAIRDLGVPLITGAPHGEITGGEVRYANSAFALDPRAPQAPAGSAEPLPPRYDKQHLVPFGEYVPFGHLLPRTLPLVHTMGNFTPGESEAPLAAGDQARAGLLICYESIFPDLARRRTQSGANLLVNLTNDAWYGRSSAPVQQLSMAVLRAVENRRSLARAANTGISCLIGPDGTILAQSPLFEEAFLTAELPLRGDVTFFTRWGYLFPHLCTLLLSLALLYGMVAAKPRHPSPFDP